MLTKNTYITVHNRIGLYLWKQESIREFRTLFVAHTDSIREKLDNKDGRVHNRVEIRRQNCVKLKQSVLELRRNIYIIKPCIFTDSSLSALFIAQLQMDLSGVSWIAKQ